MPTAVIDGINTRYEVLGSGPPLLMYSPAGFNAAMETWRTQGVYAKIKLLDHLPKHYTCITFDRRECGQSGGRVERVTWADYVAQGKGLLDHLGFAQAHIMGGCMGVSCAAAFGVLQPETTLSLVLYWPVGGAKYRLSSHQRFAEHLAYVSQNGLQGVADLVAKDGKPFNADPRGGPWASVLKTDKAFAENYVKQDLERYKLIVQSMARTLFDRDTAPGRRAGGFDAARHPCPHRPRPRQFPRHLGGALSGRMPAEVGILGRAGGAADRGCHGEAGDGVFGEGTDSQQLGDFALASLIPHAKTEEQKKIISVIVKTETIGRPLLAPPSVPAERVVLLRKALMDVVKDPEFVAEAEKAQLEISPVPGEKLQAIVKDLGGHPA